MNWRAVLLSLALVISFAVSAALPTFATTRPYMAYLAIASQTSTSSSNEQQSTETGQNDVYKIGDDLSAPVLIHSVVPRFPDAARRERLKAKVLVNIYVGIDGKPINVHSVRITYLVNKGNSTSSPQDPRVTTDLEANAVDAVRRYKFKPAMKSGKPVRVEMNVEVPFEIF
jgi:outer membrane biosynthesis protein TonB